MTTADATSDLNTLSGRIAFEVSRAGYRVMRDLYPDLPELNWCLLDGSLIATVRECHVADGTLVRWVARLGLVDGRQEWDRPGYSRYVGTVDGIEIVLAGITDRTAWNAAKSNAQVNARSA